MKLTVNSKEILKAAQPVGVLIKGNGIVPAIDNLLFKAENGKLRLTGDNLETRASVTVDVPLGYEVFALVNYDLLSKMLKGIPDTSVDLEFEGNTLKLSYANGNYSLPVLDPAAYPTERDYDIENSVTINSLDLVEGLRKCSQFVDDKDPRAISNVLIDINHDYVNIVGINGQSGVYVTFEGGGSTERLLLKKSVAGSLQSLITANVDLTLAWSGNAIFLKGDGVDISATLSEGKYPEYMAVFPSDGDRHLSVDTTFVSTIKRLHSLVDKDLSTIKLNFGGDSADISYESTNQSYNANENVLVEYSGEPLLIGFNSGFLQSVLSACGDGAIMSFSSEVKGCLIKADNVTGVLMPVRLKSE